MKKLLGIVVLGLILFVTTADAGTKRDRLRTGEIYENEIIWLMVVSKRSISPQQTQNQNP